MKAHRSCKAIVNLSCLHVCNCLPSSPLSMWCVLDHSFPSFPPGKALYLCWCFLWIISSISQAKYFSWSSYFIGSLVSLFMLKQGLTYHRLPSNSSCSWRWLCNFWSSYLNLLCAEILDICYHHSLFFDTGTKVQAFISIKQELYQLSCLPR